jgi:predicted DNA-binding transcriptional regulator YafY
VADIAARLKDADGEVQVFAARALRELGRDAASAREALQAALNATKDPELRKEIVEALAATNSSPKD